MVHCTRSQARLNRKNASNLQTPSADTTSNSEGASYPNSPVTEGKGIDVNERWCFAGESGPDSELMILKTPQRSITFLPTSTMATANAKLYDPRQVLDHPEFKILGPNDKPTKGANIAVFYNHHHELHMVEKPRPKPGPGQVLLHVRASGICG